MTERGFERKTNNGIWYLGLKLRPEQQARASPDNDPFVVTADN
jgi:hypothetical protein